VLEVVVLATVLHLFVKTPQHVTMVQMVTAHIQAQDITVMVHVLTDMKMTVLVHVHHPARLPVGRVMAGVMMAPMVFI
jgi:hypothetical protein